MKPRFLFKSDPNATIHRWTENGGDGRIISIEKKLRIPECELIIEEQENSISILILDVNVMTIYKPYASYDKILLSSRINWSALGSSTIEETIRFMKALKYACEIAKRLDKLYEV